MSFHQKARHGRGRRKRKEKKRELPYAGTTQIRFKEYFSVACSDTSSRPGLSQQMIELRGPTVLAKIYGESTGPTQDAKKTTL
jgi:hypothetical protein